MRHFRNLCMLYGAEGKICNKFGPPGGHVFVSICTEYSSNTSTSTTMASSIQIESSEREDNNRRKNIECFVLHPSISSTHRPLAHSYCLCWQNHASLASPYTAVYGCSLLHRQNKNDPSRKGITRQTRNPHRTIFNYGLYLM